MSSNPEGHFSHGEDLTLAHRLADAADSITLKRYQAIDLAVTTKPDNTPVTDADKSSEEAIRALLHAHRPNDGIVGEEFGNEGVEKNRYWVIDPIDGTKNFLRGVPTWATLIALVERTPDGKQRTVVSVVSAPALFRRWSAHLGGGAFVTINHETTKRIHVSGVSKIEDASISYSDFAGWGEMLEPFQNLLSKAWRTRGYGDFWSHMLVAEGALEAAVEPILALWDMAALDLIVTEAGGIFSNTDGTPGPHGGNGVSANAALHSFIIESLRK
ncbi:SuhB Archaeal fructose-1,6-bisphosphatase and related enzymes of inositol monophosphatase family [Candidatus Nanopelagicaceae bacterium]